MSTDERPFNYGIVWEDKPALRAIYRTYYEEIRARCRPGQTREIGGGSERVDGHNRLGRAIEIDPSFDAASCERRRLHNHCGARYASMNAKQQVAGPRGAQPRRFGSKREWLRSNFVARRPAQS
jgi:hypothetical protein